LAIKSNNKSDAPASWETLSAEMGDSGVMSYDMFAARWEAEDQLPDPKQKVLHNLVKNFDKNGVVVKIGQEQPPVKNASAGPSMLDTTAQRAADNMSA
jgi:hypothetical protein